MAKARVKTKTNARDKPSTDFLSELDKRQREEQLSARKSLRKYCRQLAKLGVEIVTINYDGYGDSGTVEDPVALKDGKPLKLPDKLTELLVQFVEAYLPFGWEINDGACGEVVLNVKDRRFSREHCWRQTSYEHEEEEIPL